MDRLMAGDRWADVPGRLTLDTDAGRGFADAGRGLVAALEAGLAALPGLATRGFAGVLGLVAALALLAVVPPDELLDAADRTELALADAGLADAGLAADMVLAAAVSAFVAEAMALVAVFMACSAVDIVLADDVALVAAVVIMVAAEVTFAAADETVLAAAAAVGVLVAAVRVRVAAPRAALDVMDLPRVPLAGRVAAFLVRPLPCVLVPARFAEPREAAVRAVRCTGIDIPPVVINYGRAIPRLAATYTGNPQEQGERGPVGEDALREVAEATRAIRYGEPHLPS
jgi:hypothetical protein